LRKLRQAIKICYLKKESESMQKDLTLFSAKDNLVTQNQVMDRSSDTGAGALSTIEGPEIALYKDLLQRFIGSEIRSVKLGQKCRSCRNIDALSYPRTITDVDAAGQKMWLKLRGAAIVLSFCSTTFLSFDDVKDSDQKHVGLVIETSCGRFAVVDRHRFVWAAIMNDRDLDREVLSKALVSVISVKDIEALSRCAKDNSTNTETIAEAISRSHVVSGIGPRLASEALYAAFVSPWRIAKEVYQKEWERFFLRIHDHWGESVSAMLASPAFDFPWSVSTKVWMLQSTQYGGVTREKCAKNFVVHWVPAVQR